jgi:Flp pilus assembly protein TadG
MGRKWKVFKTFIKNNKGVEGLPLKFAIIVLLAAIMMGAVIYMATMMKTTITQSVDVAALKAACETNNSADAPCVGNCYKLVNVNCKRFLAKNGSVIGYYNESIVVE